MMSVSSLLSSTLALPACSAFSTLPFEGQDRLDVAVAALLGRAAGAVALDDEQLRLLGVGAVAVVQLAGKVQPAADRRLARAPARRPPGWPRAPWPPGSPAPAIASPTLLFLSRKFSSRGRTIDSTCALISGLFSRPLVWPWNCGSCTQTASTAVSPSRMSSPLDLHPLLDQVVRLHEPLHGRADRRAACPARGCRRRGSGSC